jgi:YbbR domain-containing protein
VLELVRTNLHLKLLALAIATCAWAYLRFAENPVISARFNQQVSVPISVVGLRPGLSARLSEHQALVTIITPRGQTAPVKPEDVKAVTDLADRGVGVYNVPVAVIADKLDVKSLSPASVTLRIEQIEDRGMAVQVDYAGDRRDIVFDQVHVDPWRIIVRGATSDLAKVANVRVSVPVAEGRFDAMVKPAASDVHGASIEGVTITPELVRVSAVFSRPMR